MKLNALAKEMDLRFATTSEQVKAVLSQAQCESLSISCMEKMGLEIFSMYT